MRWFAALLAGVVAAAPGCGDEDSAKRPRLVVSAAASMRTALSSCSPAFRGARVRLSFAGSDELAAQIRRGFRPDVYAAASTDLPGRLHGEGLLEAPVRFATNELVVALPAGSRLRSVRDLARRGLRLALGSESVPIGIYTSEALSRLPAPVRRSILANVRSREPDVRGIVGKLAQGAADAGFVYASDVRTTHGRLESLRLPPALRPTVVYAAGVVRRARQPALARRYLRDLVAGRCRRALATTGFGAPR